MREERNKTSLNKGFTMAELLIVIAMMTILAAFGFVAVANYQKSLKITEMDDTAREIFIAAQNHLSAVSADGSLTQYYTAESGMKDADAVQITDRSVLTDCPTIPPAETDRHDFYYLVHLKGDSISADSLLDAVLPFGAIDETVRTDYSYVIEIDAKTASVYSVFYTDSLSVPLTDKEYRIVRSLKDFRQNKTVRKEYKAESQRQIIGYYGGTVAGVFSEGPKLSVELTINNSDTLSAIVKDTTAENTAERLLTLIIEGRQSGVREKFTIESDGSVTGTVLSETAGSADTENLKKAITISADKKTYAITLDDITTRTGHFHDIMPDYIPGEDITVTARLTAGTSKPAEDAKTVNSLFDSIKAGTAENEFTASLASGRHLQNLEPSISSTPVITTANPCYISKAVEIADIDWNDFISDKSVFMSDGTEIEDGQFLSIISSVLYDFNGKGYVISNLNAAANGNNAGLFAEASVKKGEAERSLIIQNVFLMNPHISTEADGGAAGGIAGLAGTNVTIASCGVYAENADAYDAAYISAGLNGSAGGLVGKINQQSDRKTGLVSDDANPGTDKETESDIIYASFASVRTISKAYAGGLVGSVDGADRGLVIKDSYASGAVNPDILYDRNDASVQGNISSGGLLGMIRGALTVENCYSTASAYSAGSAGGFAGTQQANVTYTNCYATGSAIVPYNTQTQYAGSFAGQLAENAQLNGSGNAVLTGINLKWYDPSWTEYNPSLETDTARPAGYTTLLQQVGSNKAASYAAITEIASGIQPFASVNASAKTYQTALQTDKYAFKAVNHTQSYSGSSTKPKVLFHYGDWPAAAAGTKITKYITGVTSTDTIAAIKNSIYLTVAQTIDGVERTVKVNLKNVTATDADNGNTYTLYLPAGNFTMRETGRKPTGISECETRINDDVFYDDVADADIHSDFQIFTGTAAKKINVTNTYSTAASLEGTGILYYEKVNGLYYYHGYLDRAEVYTPGSNLKRGLVNTSGAVVSESGYVIVVSDYWDVQKITVSGLFKNKNLNSQISNKSLINDANLNRGLGVVSGYTAYRINEDKIEETAFTNWGDSSVTIKYDHSIFWYSYTLYINPYFADEIYPIYWPFSQPNTAAPYYYSVRSAQQVKWLESKTSGYINYYPGNTTITQTLDIDFKNDSPKINSVMANSVIQADIDRNGVRYSMNNLSGTFIGGEIRGTVQDMVFNNVRVPKSDSALIQTVNNGGKVNNVLINQMTSEGSGLIYTLSSSSSDVIDCHITNSYIKKSGLIQNLEYAGKVTDCSVSDSTIYGAGLIQNLNQIALLDNCSVTDSQISGAGLIEQAALPTTISNCTLTRTSIGKAGLIQTLGRVELINNCDLIDCKIGGAGLIDKANGVFNIENCDISGTNSTADSTVGGAGFIRLAANNTESEISSCSIINTAITGTGFIDSTGNNSIRINISDCNIKTSSVGDSTHASDGFIGTANYIIIANNCNLIDTTVTGNGFIGTLSNPQSLISSCGITSVSIGKNGFIGTNYAGQYYSDASKGIIQCTVNGVLYTEKDEYDQNVEKVRGVTIGGNGFAGTNIGKIYGSTVSNAISIGIENTDNISNTLSGNGFVGINEAQAVIDSSGGYHCSVDVLGNIYGNGFAGTNNGSIRYSTVNLSKETVTEKIIKDGKEVWKPAEYSLTVWRNGFAEINQSNSAYYQTVSGYISESRVDISGAIKRNGFVSENAAYSQISSCSVSAAEDRGTLNTDDYLDLYIGTEDTADTVFTFAGFANSNELKGKIYDSSIWHVKHIYGDGFINLNRGSISAGADNQVQVNAKEIDHYGFADTNDGGSLNNCIVDTVIPAGAAKYALGRNINSGSFTGCRMNGIDFTVNPNYPNFSSLSISSLEAPQESSEPSEPSTSATPSASASAEPEETVPPTASAGSSPSTEPSASASADSSALPDNTEGTETDGTE